jgi:hypothetical protein
MDNPLRVTARQGGEPQRAAPLPPPAEPDADAALETLMKEAVHEAQLNFCWGFCRWLRCCCSMHDAQANRDFAHSPLYWKEPSALSCLLSLALGVIYGLVGWPCRQKEQSSFRALVTPTHFVVDKIVYLCLCCKPARSVQVIPLRRVQAVDVDWCFYKTLRVYTGDRGDDDQPAVSIVCLENTEALKVSLQSASSAMGFAGFATRAGAAK